MRVYYKIQFLFESAVRLLLYSSRNVALSLATNILLEEYSAFARYNRGDTEFVNIDCGRCVDGGVAADGPRLT